MSKAVHRTLEAKLAALDGPEWDSSDEETPVIPLEKKSKSSKKSAASKKSQAPKKKKTNKSAGLEVEPDSSRVIYVGHLPPNFEEPELRGFLQQFGIVTRIKLSRSKKTANSKGYAFCEFNNAKTAAIVADTMSNYLMSQKRLVCHMVPSDKIHPSMFDGHDRKWNKMDWRGMHREKVNQDKSAETMQRITRQLLKRERKKRQKLKDMGIAYNFPGYKESAKSMMELEKTARSPEGGDDSPSSSKKRRKVSVDANENLDAIADDDDGLEKEEEAPARKSSKKQSRLSDSSKTEKKKKRKTSDAGMEAKKVQIEPLANQEQREKRTPKSAESKKSKKASKKRRAST